MKTTIPTAPWQKDSADYAEGMDNNNHPSYKALTKYAGNQHGGAAEGNFGRGATRGNTGRTANEGSKRPMVDAVPSTTKIKNPDYINGGAQVRTPGGTRSWCPSGCNNYNGNPDAINVGRGPTKGNKQ